MVLPECYACPCYHLGRNCFKSVGHFGPDYEVQLDLFSFRTWKEVFRACVCVCLCIYACSESPFDDTDLLSAMRRSVMNCFV